MEATNTFMPSTAYMERSEYVLPALFIEVTLRQNRGHVATPEEVREKLQAWLIDTMIGGKIGESIPVDDNPELSNLVTDVEITGSSGAPSKNGCVVLFDGMDLDIQVFTLNKPETLFEPNSPADPFDGDEVGTACKQSFLLPNEVLKSEWKKLIYDDDIPNTLLRQISANMYLMADAKVDTSQFNWYGLVLLHGPPGSGKTTLCRAIAQKLSIRASQRWPIAIFVEIGSNDLLSMYFGQSGKRITQTFDRVRKAAKDNVLVCVVIDEIETIACVRSNDSDNRDAMRATNQLLTAIDSLRDFPNVLVLATTNMVDSIDKAFTDRVDIQHYIPPPVKDSIYEMFRSGLTEMIKVKIIDVNKQEQHSTHRLSTGLPTPSNTHNAATAATEDDCWIVISSLEVPTINEARVRGVIHPHTPGARILKLATQCEEVGMSGRTIRRLPMQAFAKYGVCFGKSVSLENIVKGLEMAVTDELANYPNNKLRRQVVRQFQLTAEERSREFAATNGGKFKMPADIDPETAAECNRLFPDDEEDEDEHDVDDYLWL